MARRNLLIFLLSLCVTLPCLGQSADVELQKLVDIVKSLRGGSAAFAEATAVLASDPAWTPMNELRAADASAECRASDKVPGFRLNKLLAASEQAQRFETSTGNMLNGEDARFNYSLFERGIKAGATAVYTLRGREGAQTFVILPYDGGSGSFAATISCGGVPFEVKEYTDGSLVFTGNVASGQPLTLSIANTSGRNISFAILNHNSRR